VIAEKKMDIKLGSILTMFLIFSFGRLEIIYAQQSSPKEICCQQSAEEILSEIDTVYDLSPASDKVLVAGEVYAPQLLASEKNLSLTQALAMVGGFSKFARLSVYLLRQAIDGEARTVMEIDLRQIKTGQTKDILLENGDVVFVPRRCANGKPVPLTNTPKKVLPLVDAMIRLPNAPFAQERPEDN